MSYFTGRQFEMVSGRLTTPFPKTGKRYADYNKKYFMWLFENALNEAKTRQDRLYFVSFQDDLHCLISLKKYSPPLSSVSSACLYCFGNEFACLKPVEDSENKSQGVSGSD